MSQRTTDERLAEIEAMHDASHCWHELLQALKAERQYAEELGRVPLTESQAAKMMRRIRDLETQLARARELLPTIMSRAAAVGQYCDELEAAINTATGEGK